ncbi:MAG: GDSL-type esterase/lipase family protein, partial [Chloroflexota bacterium]
MLCLAAIAPAQAKDSEDGDIPWTPVRIDEGNGKIDYFRSFLAKADVEMSAAPLSAESTLAAPAGCPADMGTYWKLDETSSGTYADAVGTNDGSCAGTCPTPTTDAKIGGAQQFNGSSGTGIDIPADAAFNWAAGDNFSIEYWLKTSSTCSGNEVIVGRQGTVHPEPHIWTGCSSSGEAVFVLYDDSGSDGGNNNWPYSGAAINDGNWHHIVVVKDATHIRLYMDGQEKASVAKSYPSGFSSTTPFNLGYLNLGGKYRYNGILDEVALYSRALTPTEIKSHYYLARGYCEGCDAPVRIMPLGDSITVGNASGVVPDDAQHWVSYRKDLWESLNLAGYNVDFVGSQVNGDAFDPPFDSQHEGHGGWHAAGGSGGGIAPNIYDWLVANPADVVLLHIGTNDISGGDEDAGEVATILDEIDRYSEDITVVLARIINRRDGSAATTAFNDAVEAMAQDRITNPANPAYPDKIIIVDMEDGIGMVYGQAPSSGDMWDNLHPYETGYAKMSGGWLNGDSFGSDGLVDFLPVCAADTCPAGMISYWRLDDNSGSTAADSYDSHPGTLFDGPTWTGSGIVNGALTFDGNNDRVQVASSTDFDIATDGSFSAFTWFKKSTDCGTNAGSQNEVMLDRTYPGNHGSNTWWFGCGKDDDKLTIMFFPASKDAASEDGIIRSTTTVDNGQWHHGGWVYDGQANELRLYLDGQLQGTDQITLTADFDSTNPLCIGGYDVDGTCDTYEFNGTLDEVAVYNRALSLAEIQDQYNNGSGKDYCGAPAATGSITIVKDTNPAGGTGFNFSGDLGSFALDDGQNQVFSDQPAGNYDVTESLPTGWYLSSVDCTGGGSTPIANGVTIHLDPGEDITCTFNNEELTVPACPAEMISYWPLEETSGSDFQDIFDGNDAYCESGHCPDFATGLVGGALDFNGTDDFLRVPDDDSLDWASDDSFSVELWAKLGPNDCNTRNKVMIGRDNRPGGVHWWLGCNVADKAAMMNLIDTSDHGAAVAGTTPINDDQWHHIVAVRDESSDENRIYVDGVLEGTTSYDYGAGFDATTTLGIGYMAYTGTPDYYYNGLLDEVALYQRTLSESEILQHYNAGQAGLAYCEVQPLAPTITSIPGTQAYVGIPYSYDVEADGYPAPTYTLTTKPAGMTIDEDTGLISWTPSSSGDYDVTVEAHNSAGFDDQSFTINVAAVTPCPANMSGYWRLDEATSGTYADSFGTNDGSCAGPCPSPISDGKVNRAQLFNGSTTGIDIPADTAFDWGANDSFTIEFWMKGISGQTCAGTGVNNNEVIVGRDDSSTNLHWWFGCANTTGYAHFQLGDKTGDSIVVEGPSISDGQWHHLVGVRDGVNGVNRLYVDGVEAGSVAKTYSAGFDSATAALNLGWLNLSGGFHYEGTLDEVALYDRALSETEVKTHYYLARGFCDGCATPVQVMPLGDSITV